MVCRNVSAKYHNLDCSARALVEKCRSVAPCCDWYCVWDYLAKVVVLRKPQATSLLLILNHSKIKNNELLFIQFVCV